MGRYLKEAAAAANTTDLVEMLNNSIEAAHKCVIDIIDIAERDLSLLPWPRHQRRTRTRLAMSSSTPLPNRIVNKVFAYLGENYVKGAQADALKPEDIDPDNPILVEQVIQDLHEIGWVAWEDRFEGWGREITYDHLRLTLEGAAAYLKSGDS